MSIKIITSKEGYEYFQNGQHHRIDGPAVKYDYGIEEWYRDGKLHRDDGPAVVCDAFREWWKDGIRMSAEINGGIKSTFVNGVVHSTTWPDGTIIVKNPACSNIWKKFKSILDSLSLLSLK